MNVRLLRSLLAPPLVALGLGLAPFDEAADKVAAFQKAFRSTAKQPKASDVRKDAIGLLANLDLPVIAEALVDAYADVEDEVFARESRKAEVDAQIAAIVKGQEFGTRNLDSKVMATYQALGIESVALATFIEGLHSVEKALLARAEQITSDESIAWLVTNVIGQKKLPLTLKLFVSHEAGGRGDAMAVPMMKALAKATTAEELAVVLEGIGDCGKSAQSCAPTVLKALENDDANVREQAAYALARLAVPTAIEPLIARLELEEGATRRRLGIALEVLTRQKLGDSVRAWRDWLAKEGADYVAGKKPLGGGSSGLAAALTAPADPKKNVYYYGIPLEGKSIVYVIDCSGSMIVSAKHPEYKDNAPVDAGDESRMEATKDALIEVLGKLTKGDKFDIVCFNDVVQVYSPTMLVGATNEIKKAQGWVRELHGASTTNIHDAMQEAFKLAGRGAQDKYYKSVVDTIFLLTDGSPTKVDNTPDSTERIIEDVRRWNPTKHVVIHTIGIGKDLNVPFLQQIAKDNGGRFVQQ